jgi:hypothetical protein
MIAIGVVQYRWWFRRHPQKKHDLDAPLILSLTSYPARYKTLVYTLRCLLTQTIKPDQVVLWISYTDQSTIPNEVLGLCGDGLKIHFCEDTKSYKKIIPTLQAYPNCYVITVDDDLFYEAKMVERLINSFQPHKREVICNRGHLITLDITKNLIPIINGNIMLVFQMSSILDFYLRHQGQVFCIHQMYSTMMYVNHKYFNLLALYQMIS